MRTKEVVRIQRDVDEQHETNKYEKIQEWTYATIVKTLLDLESKENRFITHSEDRTEK